MNILISACLLGLPCRYDGTGKGWEGAAALKAAVDSLGDSPPRGLPPSGWERRSAPRLGRT